MMYKFFLLFIMYHFCFSDCLGQSLISQKSNPSCEYLDHALFFAVETYEHDALPKLNSPIKNATEIATALEEEYCVEPHIWINPSIEDIEKVIYAFRDSFLNGDTVRFNPKGQLTLFFSGHGLSSSGNGYFMAADSDPLRPYRTALAYDIWRPIINEINCKHILVVIDACYSVTFDPDWESRSAPRFSRPGEIKDPRKTLIQNHKKFICRKFFTSDANEDYTPDQSDFARQILESLRKGPARFGLLTTTELFSYLEYANPKPHMGNFGDDEAGSSFIYFKKNLNKQDSLSRFDSNGQENVHLLYPITSQQIPLPQGWDYASKKSSIVIKNYRYEFQHRALGALTSIVVLSFFTYFYKALIRKDNTNSIGTNSYKRNMNGCFLYFIVALPLTILFVRTFGGMTDYKINKEYLKISTGLNPVSQKKSLIGVKQLFVASPSNKREASINLYAINQKDKKELLIKGLTIQQTQYLEQEIEIYLGINDIPPIGLDIETLNVE